MPSDLQVSNIRDLTNANSAISIASDGQVTIAQNNPTVTLGSNTTFPANSILQHKHVLLTGLAQQDHQSTTEASTSVTASITPKETGSKIHVIFNFYSGFIVNSGSGLEGTQRIKRTGSSVTDAFIGSVSEHNMYFEAGVRTSNAQSNFPYTLSVVDTPGHSNTTDPITYTLHVNAGVSGSGTLAIRLYRGGNGTANLTFLEIKQ